MIHLRIRRYLNFNLSQVPAASPQTSHKASEQVMITLRWCYVTVVTRSPLQSSGPWSRRRSPSSPAPFRAGVRGNRQRVSEGQQLRAEPQTPSGGQIQHWNKGRRRHFRAAGGQICRSTKFKLLSMLFICTIIYMFT